MDSFEELKELIKRKQVILFVGAGVSATLGMPSWKLLLNKIGESLGYDPEVFSILGSENYLVLAEYYKLITGSIGPLTAILDEEWHKGIDEKIKQSSIHKSIVDLNFPIIYTTNYDRYIERSFEVFSKIDSFVKITAVKNLKNIAPDKTQIIKFHGDFDNDKSIVLSESDYFTRLNFESALDIKFRSDTLGKSILFIGYSVSDINIRYTLYKLSKLWEGEDVAPKSFLFSNNSNDIQEKVLKEWNVHLLTNNCGEKNIALTEFLNALNS